MIRLPRWLLAGVLVGLVPTAAAANYLTFRNELPQPITVNTTCTVGGKVYQNRPVTLRPAEKVQMPRVGDMVVTISDPRSSSRIFFQGALPSGTAPLSFCIRPDPANPGKAKVFRVAEGQPRLGRP